MTQLNSKKWEKSLLAKKTSFIGSDTCLNDLYF